MTDTKLPIFRTAFLGWRDGLAALRSMPAMAAIVFVVVFVEAATDDALRPAATPETLATTPETMLPLLVLRLAVPVFVYGVALTPAAIAIHRYVLLGETAKRFILNLTSLRFRRFTAYSAVLNLLVLAPIAIADVLTDSYLAGAVSILGVVALVGYIATTILFPAIAVDAPGAGISNAMKDLHFFRALLISIVTVLPLLALFFVAIWWMAETPSGSTLDWIFYVAWMAAVSGVLFGVFTAMSSHLYRAWADRLQQPAGGAS